MDEVDGGTSVEGGNFVEQDARFIDETVACAGNGTVVDVVGGAWDVWWRWGRGRCEQGVMFVNFVITEAIEDALRQRGERNLWRVNGGIVGIAGTCSRERWRRRRELVAGFGDIVLAQPWQDSPQGRWSIVFVAPILRTARALQDSGTRIGCGIHGIVQRLGRLEHVYGINTVICGSVLKVQGVAAVFTGVK